MLIVALRRVLVNAKTCMCCQKQVMAYATRRSNDDNRKHLITPTELSLNNNCLGKQFAVGCLGWYGVVLDAWLFTHLTYGYSIIS